MVAGVVGRLVLVVVEVVVGACMVVVAGSALVGNSGYTKPC